MTDKRNLGFTMVELLLVLVILGILMGGAIFGVSSLMNQSHKKYYVAQEKSILASSKLYASDHKAILPRRNGYQSMIKLSTLISNGYIDPVKDKDNKSCSANESYVRVQRKDDKYNYDVYLKCPNYFSKELDKTTNTKDFQINWNVVKKDEDNHPIDNGKAVNKYLEVNVTASSKNPTASISQYRYTIYKKKNNKYRVFFESPLKDYTNEVLINNYLLKDGIYKIKVSVSSQLGQLTEEREYTIDTKPPKVPKATIRINSKSGKVRKNTTKWINKTLWFGNFRSTDATTSVDRYEYSDGCTGNKTGILDSEIVYRDTIKKNICIRAIDELENTSEWSRPYYIRIDKIDPVCTNSGGVDDWTADDVTITGFCSDSGGSGCEQSSVEKTYSTDTNITKISPGTVYDNAGNSAICASDRTVKVDKTPPTCKNSGGGSNWTKGNVTITGACSDSGSGCKTPSVKVEYTTDTNTTTASPGVVEDKVGHKTTCESDRTVRIDKTPPTCKNSGGGDAWTKGDVTITGTCSDSGSGCKTPNVEVEYTTDTNLSGVSPGVVEDKVGNKATCPNNRTIKIDKTPPSKPRIDNPSDGKCRESSFKLTVSTRETGSGIASWKYKSGGSWHTYSGSAGETTFTTPNVPEMTGKFYIKACDNAGNCSEKSSTNIKIKNSCEWKCNIRGNRIISVSSWSCNGPKPHTRSDAYIHYCKDPDGKYYVNRQELKDKSGLSNVGVNPDKVTFGLFCAEPECSLGSDQGYIVIND